MSTSMLKIHILDKEYQVSCKPEEREALLASAAMLNEKMDEIRQGSHIIGLERVAVMAALNLAHELLSAKNDAQTASEATGMLSRLDSKLSSAISKLQC